MAWIILLGAILIDGVILLVLRREVPRWQEAGGAFALVAPLRLVTGSLLMLLILLVAIGIVYALPVPGTGTAPSPLMLTYWLFILLLVGAIVLLTLADFALVRRGFQRRQEEAFREALLGQREHRDDC
ncbi:MAG: hypothetical protein GX774_18770 [Armatimonadetes bacterium]|jgi:protein-S-isoprenylcysteine O-methyltransferase Ste14|nr:hypothetical protein [Armatimonadota bacterium]